MGPDQTSARGRHLWTVDVPDPFAIKWSMGTTCTRPDQTDRGNRCPDAGCPVHQPYRQPVASIDYSQLDPGIRDIVRQLRDAGFETTDSGDGHSKAAEIFDGEALDYAHVFCVATPGHLVAEAKLLAQALNDLSAPARWRVEGSYSPADDSALLLIVWDQALD